MKTRIRYSGRLLFAVATTLVSLCFAGDPPSTTPTAASAKTDNHPTVKPLPPFEFRVGDIRCTVLYDETATYPLEALYANVPKEELLPALQKCGAPSDHVETPYEGLLVRTKSNLVLIDTGAGPSSNPAQGRLMASLEQAGVRPEDIDTVIITHAHGDHIGGTILKDGTAAFPKAKYVVSRAEWEFWDQGAPNLSRLKGVNPKRWTDLARKNLLSLRDRIELVERDGQIRPGISGIITGAHTPGHMVVRVESGTEKMIVVGDLILSPVLLEHPTWHTKYDWDPALLESATEKLLREAAAEKILVHAMHFAYPSLGHVSAAETGYTWRPINSQ